MSNSANTWQIAALQLIDAAEREMSGPAAWDYAHRAVSLIKTHGEISAGILGSRRWPDTWQLKRIIAKMDNTS